MSAPILHTPVLFLCFNRPDCTQRVFDSIRKVKPQKLYIAVDAPREGRADDVENNNKVKEIVSNVDWECETHYLFQEKNLGCSKSGVTAWNWIFETEDRMIFVEDDGLGSSDAFYFIQDMLERYKDDERIAYVGAVNYGPKYGDKSYFFSREPAATYFMGTWRRVNDLYDYDLDTYEDTSRTKEFRSRFRTRSEYIVKQQLFKSYRNSVLSSRRQNTYDVQMTYLSYVYDLYSIYPNVNLVSNIGLDGGANNDVNPNSSFYKEYANRAIDEFKEIKYTQSVFIDDSFEKMFYRKRALYNRKWYMVWLKSFLLEHFGTFYSRYIKPLRWDR